MDRLGWQRPGRGRRRRRSAIDVRPAIAGILLFATAGCSGGPPPETSPPSAGQEHEPSSADRTAEQPKAEPGTPNATEPTGRTSASGTPAPDAAAADAPPQGQPQEEGEAAEAAEAIGDLFAPSAQEGAGAFEGAPTMADLIDDAAAAEQAPGFALPPGATTPSVAAPPTAIDSLELVDRVVAIVGDTAILMSEVRETIFQLQAQGLELPPDRAGQDSLALATLESMVEELMIVKQAEFAGIEVTEDDLDDEVERRFETIRSRFGSDQEMLQRVEQSGQNMYQFRRMLRSQARKDMLAQRYVGTRMGSMTSVRVTESEIEAVFIERAAGAQRPATLDMVQVVIEPKPSEAARDSALQEARVVIEEIRAGEDFEVAAHRYSDDQGTRAEGGDLGWIRRSEVVPAFGDAAWAVRTGIAVGPVETRFGFHIIKVENVRGGERHIRHILIRPVISPEQVELARELAEAVADSLRDGADPTVMAKRYGTDPEDSRLDGVRVDRIAGAMGAAFAEALTGAQTGDVVGPFEVADPPGLTSFVTIKVIRFRPQGDYDLAEVRDQIRDQLLQQKQYEALVEQLRQEVYVRLMI